MRNLFLLSLGLFIAGCGNDTDTAATSVKTEQPQQQQAQVQPAQNVQPAATAAAPKEVPTSLSGETLFRLKCASCHGQQAEKSALGKSEIIATWESGRIEAAISGYRAGSYGKSMKALMQAQVKELGDEDIKVLSEYISSL